MRTSGAKGNGEKLCRLLSLSLSFFLSLSAQSMLLSFFLRSLSRSLYRAYGSEARSRARLAECDASAFAKSGAAQGEGEGEVTVAETVWGTRGNGGYGCKGGQSGGRPAVTPARLSPKSESERASRDCAPPC